MAESTDATLYLLLKDVDFASTFAAKEVEDLTHIYDAVGRFGFFRKLWDSKVPVNKKRIFNLISFSLSDPEQIQEEIKNYSDFYNQIKHAMRLFQTPKVTDGNKVDNDEYGDMDELVEKLLDLLGDFHSAAESGVECTSSSTLYKVHKKFVAEHSRLESILRRVENGVLRMNQKKLTTRWEASSEKVGELVGTLEETIKEKEKLKDIIENFAKENRNSARALEEITRENKVVLVEMRKDTERVLKEKSRENEMALEEMRSHNERVLEEMRSENERVREEMMRNNERTRVEAIMTNKEILEMIKKMHIPHK